MEGLAIASSMDLSAVVARFLCLIWILCGMSVIVVGLRFFARYRCAIDFGLDDLYIAIALVRQVKYDLLDW